jgi:NAD(P)-dependent dehydrogenase (short-subunit alcohol dehydrogenase family)
MKAIRLTILISGSSSGMGYAAARQLSQEGYRVYAATRTPDRLQAIASETLIPVALDLRDRKSILKTLADLEPIDVLVNNAGYGLVSTIEEMDEAQMLAQFDVNVFGALRMAQAVIPGMRERRSGVIINISSFLGKVGLPLLTLYNASKYALEGVTDSLRHELYPFGIRVHSIMPGFFDTNFARDNLMLNPRTFDAHSPYREMVKLLAPVVVDEINGGNDPHDVARLIQEIIEDDGFPARVTAGDKAAKFIPMRRALSDEDFERRVREYYGLEGL